MAVAAVVAVVAAVVAVAAAVAAVAVGSPAAASRGSAILRIKRTTARSDCYSVVFFVSVHYTANSRADNIDFEQIELELKKGQF